MNQTIINKIAEMMYKVGSMDCIETTSGKKALWTPENCALHKLICKELANIYEEEDNWDTDLHYCKKCNRLFEFDEGGMGGAPISGTYFISPCCKRDIHSEEDIIKIKEPTFNPKQFLKDCGVEE